MAEPSRRRVFDGIFDLKIKKIFFYDLFLHYFIYCGFNSSVGSFQ